ncbi:MAG: septum formation initiator family protein [Elusimicrobiaceae bacterium]|nr:septum formation initiator family protein [Elusimicrobiaceae bacterium]
MNELKDAIIRNRKVLLWACIAVAALCWFLGKNFTDLIHNKLEQKRLAKVSAQLDQEHEQLQAQLDLLKAQDPAYIERLARVEYNMSLPGETEYRFKTK